MHSNIPEQLIPLLKEYCNQLSLLLPHKIFGIYIQGSIALADFIPNRSDIDFITVLKSNLDATEIEKVKALHSNLNNNFPYAMVMEGQYTHVDILQNNHKEQTVLFPRFFYGEYRGLRDGTIDSVSRWILSRHGLDVFGPKTIKEYISITIEELKMAMDYNINYYWANKLLEEELFLQDAWIDDSILTLCRIYYTAYTKKIISKTQSGYYGLKHFPQRWHRIIQEAIRIRTGNEQVSLYNSLNERAYDSIDFIRECIKEYNYKFIDL